MSWKNTIFDKSLCLHKIIAERKGQELRVVPKGFFADSKAMRYDSVERGHIEEYKKYNDYTRYRILELCAERIRALYAEEELAGFAVAEAGVFMGEFAWMINRLFPNNIFYLYDTFEGFDERDIKVELEKSYVSNDYMDHIVEYFGPAEHNRESKIAYIIDRMSKPEQCIFRVGYFPDTIEEERDQKYAFVSLDMDLFTPMFEGLRFFYPRLIEGGFIFVHDYNNCELKGVKQAVQETEKDLGRMKVVPISDWCGSLIITK